MSHPSWVCGLKQFCFRLYRWNNWSHPSWVCGLKLFCSDVYCSSYRVTPFVGVWIETFLPEPIMELIRSHPSWVCGLKRRRLQSKFQA